MEMDWGTALIGIISILICIIPFAFMYFNRIKKEKKMLSAINENAKQHNCNISKYENFNDFILGIDTNRKYVFFLKQNKKETISQFVNLSEIQYCHLVKKTKGLKNSASSIYATESLEICFTPIIKNKTETRFLIFNADINLQLSGELQFAEKWIAEINVQINRN